MVDLVRRILTSDLRHLCTGEHLRQDVVRVGQLDHYIWGLVVTVLTRGIGRVNDICNGAKCPKIIESSKKCSFLCMGRATVELPEVLLQGLT